MEQGSLIAISNPLPQPVYAVATANLVNQPVIITGGGEKIVREWFIEDGININGNRLLEHSDSVRAVTATQLRGHLVIISGSSDKSIRVWDLATGNPVGRPFIDPTMSSVLAVTTAEVGDADGNKRPVMVSASADGAVRIWNL
jgi:WD40 repeat protein